MQGDLFKGLPCWGVVRRQRGNAPHPLGERKTCLQVAFLIGSPVKSAFALLLTRVTEPRLRRIRKGVSLKQALAAQGFKGGTRGDTEWNQWVSVEKSALAFVMERHGIEWEHKGTHEKHLSVLDYKKQEREKEIAVLDNQLAEKKYEFQTVQSRIQNYDNGTQVIEELEKRIERKL